MNRTRIEKSIGWCDMTKNPIKGRCQGGCWYCYYSGKRGMLNRFKQDDTIRLDLSVLAKLPFQRKKIFLCSTHDLFGDWVPREWRDQIFWHIKLWGQHTFQILTKFPQDIDRPMPENVWLGVTVEGPHEIERSYDLLNNKARIKFISFEPLLAYMSQGELDHIQLLDWIIVGRLTQHGNDYDPVEWWIEEIVDICKKYNKPIFLKENLKDIWQEPLIQEFPQEAS